MMIEVRDASFAYTPRRPVFEGLALSASRGEVLCILGPNGCGKTTLLKCCAGLLAPVGGEIRVDDLPLHSLGRRAIARRIAFVPQSHDVAFPYTVLEVVLMGRTPHLSPWASPSDDDLQVALDAVERVGLTGKRDEPFSALSGGERQLALLARALCQSAALLLLDEPVAHLDLRNQAAVLGILRRLAAAGTSVSFTSHDPNHAFRIAHRVALMRPPGRLTIGSPEQVLTSDLLTEAYGIRVVTHVRQQPGRPDTRYVTIDDDGGHEAWRPSGDASA